MFTIIIKYTKEASRNFPVPLKWAQGLREAGIRYPHAKRYFSMLYVTAYYKHSKGADQPAVKISSWGRFPGFDHHRFVKLA